MKLSKFLLVAGIMASCTLFFFLSKEKGQHKEKFSQHLRVNLSEGDPTSLHPHLAADIRSRILGKALFEGLTRLTPKGKGELAAAEKVDVNDSFTRYVFSIRPHEWSNGEPVTAYQFEKSWKQAIHPDSICARGDLFYIIKNAKKAKRNELSLENVGIQALDEKTLVVELEHPAPYFL